MSLRLDRSGVAFVGALIRATLAVTLVVTLVAAMLALFPAAAEAQTAVQTGNKSTSSIVVRPGDSLWSISEEWLGPNATPQRILVGTERIYALNRERIGADPDLILVGQELLRPPTMSERPTGVTSTHKTTEASEAGPRDQATKRATKITAAKAPRTAPGGADAKGGEARKPAAAPMAEPATVLALPDVAVAAPVPAVRAVASNDAQPWSPVASFLRTVSIEFASAASALAETLFEDSTDTSAELRRLLGLGILVLTLAIAALMAWKLPMRRTTRWDAERWRRSPGYVGDTLPAYRITPFAYHPGSLGDPLGDRDRQDAWPEVPEALDRGRRDVLRGSEDPFASHEGASRTTSEARGPTAPSGDSKNRGTASEGRFAHVGLFAIARANRERVRRKQPLGLRRQVQTRSQRRPLSRHSRAAATAALAGVKPPRARHKEWEPSAALTNALKGLSLVPGAALDGDVASLKSHLEEDFRVLERLKRLRSLSKREKVRGEALKTLLASIERAE